MHSCKFWFSQSDLDHVDLDLFSKCPRIADLVLNSQSTTQGSIAAADSCLRDGKLRKFYTHWLGNQEAGEEVEQGVEEGCEDLGNLTVGCESHHHHSIEGEGDQREE